MLLGLSDDLRTAVLFQMAEPFTGQFAEGLSRISREGVMLRPRRMKHEALSPGMPSAGLVDIIVNFCRVPTKIKCNGIGCHEVFRE